MARRFSARASMLVVLTALVMLPTSDSLAGGGPPPTIVWSPDGMQIAYTARTESGAMDIFVTDANGQNPHNLSNSADCDYYPVWSPDGTEVAYSSDIDCRLVTSICVAAVIADVMPRCIPLEQEITWPRPFWSPDGAYIGYGGKGVIDTATGELRWLAGEYVTASLQAFSTDGQTIAYETGNGSNREIWLQNVDGTNNRHVTDNDVDDTFVSWSPQGSTFAYASGQEALETVTILDANDPAKPLVTLENVWLFTWSPDGSQIAYSARSTADEPSHVWVADADGANARDLAEAYFVRWSLDGERLSILGEDGAFHVDVATGEMTPLDWDVVEQRVFWSPDWSRAGLETSSGLCVLVMAEMSLHCIDVELATVPSPEWSPDGERLAYVEDGAQELTVVTMDEFDALPDVMHG